MQIDSSRGDDELALNLAPMIDVVFLLLIFFMVATTFVEPERELDLELPPAEHGAEPAPRPEELVIEVLRDGRVLVAGRELDRAALRAELERTADERAQTPVTVRGDRGADYGEVVAVLDLCHGAGLSDTGLVVRDGVP
jgi:biopolymer transport protein ExbD